MEWYGKAHEFSSIISCFRTSLVVRVEPSTTRRRTNGESQLQKSLMVIDLKTTFQKLIIKKSCNMANQKIGQNISLQPISSYVYKHAYQLIPQTLFGFYKLQHIKYRRYKKTSDR